jgi:hypothetical protein
MNRHLFVISLIVFSFLSSCFSLINFSEKKYFFDIRKKVDSIDHIYSNLFEIRPFEMFASTANESNVLIFWANEKVYENYTLSQSRHNELTDIELKGLTVNDLIVLNKLMNGVKCKYISRSYLIGDSVYYNIIGMDKNRFGKDLQYIYLKQYDTLNLFNHSKDIIKIEKNIYYRYAKAPGD